MPKCPTCGTEGESYGKDADGNPVYHCKKCDRTWIPKKAGKERGALIKLDDFDKDSLANVLLRLVFAVLSIAAFYTVAFPVFLLSMPNFYIIPVAVFMIAWVAIIFADKLSRMFGMFVVLLAVFIGSALAISYTGLDAESYIGAYVPVTEIKSAYCWAQAYTFGSLGQMQSYFQKEYAGTNPVDMAYKTCMGVGEEQKVNWGCGADCLKVSVEGTPINGKPLLLRIMLAADKSLQQDLENVKVEVYDSKGTAFETTACTKEKPCTVPKADTVEFFANIETVSCRGSAYDFKIKTSYDYSAYTPKFDVTVYQSRKEAEKKTETKSETGYGPLKLLFAGSGKYYADELQYAGGAIPVQIRMYYVPGGGTSMKNEKVVGQKVTIDVFPYTGVPECDEAAKEEGGKIVLTGKFEVGDKFSYNFYPYAFCKFKAPELEGPYKTIGFVGHADYTFEFEKSMVAICAG